MPSDTSGSEITKRKKIIYKLTALLFLVILLLFIEVFLRIFGYGYNLNLFIKHPNKLYKDYMAFNQAIGKKYFQKFEATGGLNDIFLREKTDNTFRVFVLGSSTVVGFPYSYNLSFPRILQHRLQQVYPDKKIEVVNTAITAINSITLLDYMDDVVKYRPDAILIYAGHNEYYGAFGPGSNEQISKNRFLRELHFGLMNLRIYQLLRNTIYALGQRLSSDNKDDISGTLMKRIVADKEIVYDSEKYQQGLDNFRNNLDEILQIAEKNSIPVFLSDLVSNVRDLPPFGSKATNSLPAADSVYEQAKKSETKEEYQKSLELYSRAKDLDCIRFRASEDINKVILELADKYSSYKVSMMENFQNSSQHGLIGNNLITEHVHPNIDGFFLIAEIFFKAIVNSNLIGTEPDSSVMTDYNYFHSHYGYTIVDSLVAKHKINQLKTNWPFVEFNNKLTYRDTYQPKDFLDSLTFNAIRVKDFTVAEIHDSLGSLYFNKKNYMKALEEHQALACLNPYNTSYYDKVSECYLRLNDLYSASLNLKKAMEIRESYFTCFVLGDIAMSKHNFLSATGYYKKALKHADSKHEQQSILKNLAIAYHYSKQFKESEKTIEQLKKNFDIDLTIPKMVYDYPEIIPKYIYQDIYEAKMLLADEKDKQAIDLLNNTLKEYKLPIIYRTIGEILMLNHDKTFLNYYLKAYPDYQYEPLFLKNLCIAYIVNDRMDDARGVIEQIRQLDPDSEHLKILAPYFK